MSTPAAPEGVVLNTTSGPVPVALTYVGVREDGIHVWHADAAVPLDRALTLTAARIPPRTMIQFFTVPSR